MASDSKASSVRLLGNNGNGRTLQSRKKSSKAPLARLLITRITFPRDWWDGLSTQQGAPGNFVIT